MNPNERIVIAGAGLAGSLLSLLLARQGYHVEVYEARPDMRRVDIPAGRSINLALSVRGIEALRAAGVADAIMAGVIPMRGRMIHDVTGAPHLVPYGRTPDEVIYSVSRGDLNKHLMSAAEATGRVSFTFDARCTAVDFEAGTLTLDDTPTVPFDRLLGCDGAGSVVRTAILAHHGAPFAPDFLDHGYKELTIPPAPGGGHRLDPNALHIWPRRDFMLIALPNPDGSFTGTLFLRREGPVSFAALPDAPALRAFFETHFSDALPHMPDLETEFFEHPVGALGTVRCRPWNVDDRAVILGDAAHAIVPFFGQGMNCAFEDCLALTTHFADLTPGFFGRFEAERKPNTDAIAALSLKNFIEMRDRVADPVFALRKQVELTLEARHPGVFIPQYSMVSFHRIPYAEVWRRSTLQDDILARIMADATSLDGVDWDLGERLIRESLTPIEG